MGNRENKARIQRLFNKKSRLAIFYGQLRLGLFNTTFGQTLSYLPLKQLKLGLTLAILLIFIIAYWFVVRGSHLRYSAASAEYVQYQNQITQLQQRLNKFADQKSQEQQFTELYQNIQVDVRDKWQANMILALSEAGTQLIDWQPKTMEDTLKICGSFEELMQFLILLVEKLPNKQISEMIFEIKPQSHNQEIDPNEQRIPLQLSLTLNEVPYQK